MRTIETQIDIQASASRLWSVLTDFGAYPSWNPFITEITGTPELGAVLRVRIHPPGRKPMTFRPIVIVAARDRELRWLGRLWVAGLFDGEHSFRIEDKGRACRFYQSERFFGVLVPFFGADLFDATQRGFEAMNAALKARAEGQSG
jgi:hypothetical protein